MALPTVTFPEGLMPESLIPVTLNLLMTALAQLLRRSLQQFINTAPMRRVAGTAVTVDKRPVLAVQTKLFHDIFMAGTAEAPLRFKQQTRLFTLMRLMAGMTLRRRRMFDLRCGSNRVMTAAAEFISIVTQQILFPGLRLMRVMTSQTVALQQRFMQRQSAFLTQTFGTGLKPRKLMTVKT
jgi:hypothetical protein